MDQSVSSGFLRTKISLKGNQSQLSLVSPFYGMKPELPPKSKLLGSNDLISFFDLSSAYNRYCGPRKLREDLASFLPQVCGTSHLNSRSDMSCSLRQLVEKPPITGKEISGLSASAMVGFKLTPGSVSENWRLFDLADGNDLASILPPETSEGSSGYQEFGRNFNDPEDVKAKHRKKFKRSLDEMEDSERKTKKHKGDEKEKDKKQKKKKKDKKKKKAEEDAKRVQRKEDTPAAPTITPFF